VLGALEVGLPQLLLPQGADQFVNAEMLTAAGASAH
jgi:UDP:flavonoid glycosyltransferase YjiC (YdhE family)